MEGFTIVLWDFNSRLRISSYDFMSAWLSKWAVCSAPGLIVEICSFLRSVVIDVKVLRIATSLHAFLKKIHKNEINKETEIKRIKYKKFNGDKT